MDPRYPIGPFVPSSDYSREARTARIRAIAGLPEELEGAVGGLGEEQLNTRYRPAGWTLRQVVHHLFDSHANAHARFRLALTEDAPTIKTYDEVAWSTLPDASSGPIDSSLMGLRGLHARWAGLLWLLPESDFKRTIHHPDWGATSVDWLLDQYAWHGRHHVAHITMARDRKGW